VGRKLLTQPLPDGTTGGPPDVHIHYYNV